MLKNESQLKTPSLLVHENLWEALKKIPKNLPNYEAIKENFAKVTHDWSAFHKHSHHLNEMDTIDGIVHMDFCASAIEDPKTHDEGLKAYRAASYDMDKFMNSLFDKI